MRFVKMHGCGNAYVYIDARVERVDDPSALSVRVADETAGIGSDGLILVEPSNVADARMAMFNADGSRGMMCGNGIRCLGRFVLEGDESIGHVTLGPMAGDEFVAALRSAGHADPAAGALLDLADAETVAKSKQAAIRVLDVESDAGTKRLTALECDGAVELLTVDIGPVRFMELRDGALTFEETARETDIEIGGTTYRMVIANTGNMHAVLFVPSLDEVSLEAEGCKICNAPFFPLGSNVHFVEVAGQTALNVLHWERGSGVTLACGTGASASVAAAFATGRTGPRCRVGQTGGDVVIHVTDRTVLLTGPAEYACRGVLRDEGPAYD